MSVFVLAGGLGTRIRGLFPALPKSMIPFNGRPFLEYQIALLAEQGFRRFVLCVGYRAQSIVDHFGDGTRFDVDIVYSLETAPLGTGGALHYAQAYIDGPILLVNGDTYLATDYRAVAACHRESPDAIGVIVVSEVEDTARYGQIVLDDAQHITSFEEKTASRGRGRVNAGVYVLSPRIIDTIPAGKKTSLEHEVFPALLQTGECLIGCPIHEAFIDFGTPEGYHQLEEVLREK